MSENLQTAREAALCALYKTERDGAYFNSALSEALCRVSDSDRALVTELLYGTVKRRLTLDYIIMQYSKIRLKKMTPWVRNILRLGIYQIYFTDKIPPSAACNEAVKLTKRYAYAASGFVNGVLRNAVRGKDNLTYPSKDNLINYLSAMYSFPEQMVEKLLNQYGKDECEKILNSFNYASSPSLRVNRLKTTPEKLTEILQSEGIHAESDKDLPDCLNVTGRLNINRSEAYRQGLFSLQGKGSMRAVAALEPQPGDIIMDLCAAPGGKSCYIAEKMKNCGKVLSYDLHPHKIPLIENSAKRLGIDIITAEARDSSQFIKDKAEFADRVLADVPCSGLGIIPSKPDIKWTHDETDIAALTKIQSEILECAGKYVKTGGILVYSTCTILKDENENQTQKFLQHHPEFEKCGETLLLPHKDGGTGFYICKMRKYK